MKVSRLLPGFFLTALILPISFSVTNAQTWYDQGWQFRKEITIDHTQVFAPTPSTTLPNFPVLIAVTDSDLIAKAQTDGDDIFFTDAAGTVQLDHEIESYDSGLGSLVAWVKVPSLSTATDTVIYMYYGNGSAANQESASAVWDANYVMVQHLEETSGDHIDSTSNGNDGTVSVTTQGSASGQINGADEFDATALDSIDCGDDSSLKITGSMTIEAWAYSDNLDNSNRIVSKDPTGSPGKFILWENGTGNLSFIVADDSGDTDPWYRAIGPLVTNGEWFHVVGVYDDDTAGPEVRLYVNGSEVTAATGPAYSNSTAETVTIGVSSNNGHHWTGTIDEVRISDTARSAEWILTSFNNQDDPGAFYDIEVEEPQCTDDDDCGFCEECDAGVCALQPAGEDHKEECSDLECGSGYCDGSGGCGFKAAGTECRPSTGDCDVAETCSGSSYDCPADLYLTSGTECRSAVGLCDAAEYCDGINNNCPADLYLTAGTECRSAIGDCDLAEFCDGSSNNCPVDVRSTDECRPSTGDCDLAEFCDGERDTCPPDILMPPGTICRLLVGFCDVMEFCDGLSNTCPPDAYASTEVVCRSATDVCDLSEHCTGSSADCPVDQLEPDGAICDDALYCTLTDQCQDGQCVGLGNPCTPPLVCDEGSDQCAAVPPGGWWDSSWPYRKPLTIGQANVDDDLTDFPVLVDLTDSDLGTYAQSSGNDIVFTDTNGVKLNHEIELYDNGTGHLIAWVNVTSLLSTQDTTLYIYFGNIDSGNQEDPSGTWNSNYMMVQHLDETTGTHYDSTGNANDGTTVLVTEQDATGIIQGADEFDGIGNYVKVPDATSLQFGQSSFTAEAWIYPHSVPDINGVRIVNNRGTGTGGVYAGWQLKITDSGGNWVVGPATIDDAADNYIIYSGTTPYGYNQWYHLVMVYEADNELRFYVNGELDGTLFVGPYGDITNSLPTAIGASLADYGVEGADDRQFFHGILDEIRLSNVERSAGWISTSYNNQNNPSGFYTAGSLELSTGPTVSAPNPGNGDINVSIALFELSFTLYDPDGDPMDYMITTNPEIGSDYVTGAQSGIHTMAVSGLDYETTYQWVISVTDGSEVTNRIYSFTTPQASTIWWDHNWDSRKKLTIPSDNLDVTLNDFPFLVDVTDPQLASDAQPDGHDIVFTDDSGSKLSYEIESYDSGTGRLIAWVKVPSLSSTEDTILYIYFGNSETGNQEEVSGTWDGNYMMVHHLNETAGIHYDSTINGNDGTPSVTVQGSAPGQIDGADNFDGTNDYVDCGNDTSLDLTGSLTVEAWALFTQGALRNRIVAKDATGIPGKFIFWQDATGDLTFQVYNSLDTWCLASIPINPDGSWMHVVGVFNTTDQRVRLYKDGIEVDSVICPGSLKSNTEAVTLGSSANYVDNFEGMLDEVRISSVARSAEWIQTSYSNQFDPVSFYTTEDVEVQCEGNFDCDYDCDGSDAQQFKLNFGRSEFSNPCESGNPCNGNFDCDADVDGSDARIFKQDFGRSPFSNACPPCVVGEWCSY